MNNFASAFKSWVPLGLAVTLIFGFVYLIMLQNYRSSANDPQIQIAEDNAASLESGNKVNTENKYAKVNIKESLSFFVMAFDENQKEVLSTANLDGSSPEFPQGIFDNAKKKGEINVTWQPEKGTRIALVVKYYDKNGNSGFVAVGRSLRETEARIMNLIYMTLLGWIISMLITYLAVYYNHNNGFKINFNGIKLKSNKNK